VGARPAAAVKPPPPPAQVVPVLLEPPALSTPATVKGQSEPVPHEESETPAVVVVTSDQPAIIFPVPTMGNLVVPTALAQAPPARPLEPAAPLPSVPAALKNTGTGSRVSKARWSCGCGLTNRAGSRPSK
jgi:hypothetical protein